MAEVAARSLSDLGLIDFVIESISGRRRILDVTGNL